MDFRHPSQPWYDDYGLSPQERAYMIAERRHEAAEHGREQIRALNEVGRQQEKMREVPGEVSVKVSWCKCELCLREISIFVWLPQGQPEPASPTSPRRPSPTAPPTTVFTPSSVYTKEQIASVIIIQHYYRAQRALASIKDVQAQYDSIRGSFVFPTKLDFEDDGRLLSADFSNRLPESSQPDGPHQSPKSAFTRNVPLHQYIESLGFLLVSLDAVNSKGVERVQEKRRVVMKQIEAEARSLERRAEAVRDSQHREVSSSPDASESSLASFMGTPSLTADGPSSSPPSSAQLSDEVMNVKRSEDLPADAPPTGASGDHPVEDATPIDSGVTSCSDEDASAHSPHDSDPDNFMTQNATLANNPQSPKLESGSQSPFTDPKVTAPPGDVQEHLPLETMLVDGPGPPEGMGV
jgi:hypothetical protein